MNRRRQGRQLRRIAEEPHASSRQLRERRRLPHGGTHCRCRVLRLVPHHGAVVGLLVLVWVSEQVQGQGQGQVQGQGQGQGQGQV